MIRVNCRDKDRNTMYNFIDILNMKLYLCRFYEKSIYTFEYLNPYPYGGAPYKSGTGKLLENSRV